MSEQPKLKEPRKVMPAPTAWLFEEIRINPLLSPFILIGGTGLSLHIEHRVSEDLDLITLLPKLPRAALKELEKQLEKNGHQIEHQVDPDDYDDSQIFGFDLADSQQNWIADGAIKLTFFTAAPEHAILLTQTQSEKKNELGLKIASFKELCQLKAIVTAGRSKSRDWLDLFILERDHQFGVAKWKEAFDQAGLTPMQFEIALNRMCKGRLNKSDEGYSSLLPNPPNIEEMQTKFRSLRESYEKSLAKPRAKQLEKPDGNDDTGTPSNP